MKRRCAAFVAMALSKAMFWADSNAKSEEIVK
jgi:hypothetical protein